ncbi:hypothetical protein H4Q26_013303 [Puccinia striiformis f. sp. tritici PST-130]|nr:hypothetical protein H4Q26_013303 [Puccinia striiformis f. sp. tritici PST-130]
MVPSHNCHEVYVKDAVQDVVLPEVVLNPYSPVKETWNGYGLDLVNYQNKTQPIRGWNNLFNKCSEHSATWAQMKFSPHYRTYDEDVKTWTN